MLKTFIIFTNIYDTMTFHLNRNKVDLQRTLYKFNNS